MSAPGTAPAKPSDWRDEYRGLVGRRRAWRGLMLGDHGIIRKVYDNTHEISPGRLWRSYQPSPADLARWKARGVKTIINLRGPKPSAALFLESEACERLGLELVNFRAWSREAPPKAFLHEARALFERIAYPAMIHCKSGADRAGLVATLFMFMAEGRPLDEAMEQLSFRYGHVKGAKTGVIDAAFESYLTHARAHDIALDDVDAFLEWVDSDAYDPAALKQNYRPKMIGSLIADVVLRRE